jgi:hypothetical protein
MLFFLTLSFFFPMSPNASSTAFRWYCIVKSTLEAIPCHLVAILVAFWTKGYFFAIVLCGNVCVWFGYSPGLWNQRRVQLWSLNRTEGNWFSCDRNGMDNTRWWSFAKRKTNGVVHRF